MPTMINFRNELDTRDDLTILEPAGSCLPGPSGRWSR